ncbi:hypothetical protein RB195_016485 [Necator americanus]
MEAMVFRDISTLVRRRFPTMDHLVTSGLMTEKELKDMNAVSSPHAKYWLPIQWLLSLVTLARDEGRIEGEVIYVSLFDRIAGFRAKLINLFLFDWVPVPLVYTQVVHLAVYSYFGFALLGRQYLEREGVKKSIDLYIPIMSILQFTFIVGWVKVAEVLLNPLGEDDDDFESNWIIDRNLQVGFSVEECYDKYPPVDRDSFWETPNPEPLYTAQSAIRPINPQMGSCVNMATPSSSSYMLRPRRRTINTSSVWDGQVESDEVVPVIQNNGHIDLQSQFPTSISTSSMSNFIKKIKHGSRRLSSLSQFAKRRSTNVSSLRTIESPGVISSAASYLDCASLSPALWLHDGQKTPPALYVQPPTPIATGREASQHSMQQLEHSDKHMNRNRKRHSAPDTLQLVKKADGSRRDSYSSMGLPIILEESKDRSMHQLNASTSNHEGTKVDDVRSNKGSAAESLKVPKQPICVCSHCN